MVERTYGISNREEIMKEILKYLWQLPQNIIGLLVIKFSYAWKRDGIWYTARKFGVSLGKYIIINEWSTEKTLNHERGHQKQSLYLGWLYLIIIGLPSAIGNLWDRWFHKNWSSVDRIKWYYSQPWEHWADKLGGVIR